MSKIVATALKHCLFGEVGVGVGSGGWHATDPLHDTIWFLIITQQSTDSQVLKKRKWQIWLISIGSHVYNFFMFVFKTKNISYALLFLLVSVVSLTFLMSSGTEDDHEIKWFLFMCSAWSSEVTLKKALSFPEGPSFELQKHACWEMNVIMIRFLPYFTLPFILP